MRAIVSIGFACWLALAAGCGIVSAARKVVAPAATVTAGGTTVTQKGDAQTPGSAKTETKSQNVTLPAGTVVWQDFKTGEVRYRLGQDTVLQSETRTEQATAPASFTPPKPPTAAEEANAKADFWTVLGYRVGVFVGVAAALYGMVHAWPMVMWGGAAVGGACLFGLFVKSHPLLLVIIGIGVALKVAGPLLWHTKIKTAATQ